MVGGVPRVDGGGVARREGGAGCTVSPTRRMDVPPARETLSPQTSPRHHPHPHPQPQPQPQPLLPPKASPAPGPHARRVEGEERGRRSGQPSGCTMVTMDTSPIPTTDTAAPLPPKKTPALCLRLPFAEEGNLTIKQRPRLASGPRQDQDQDLDPGSPPSPGGPAQSPPKTLDLPQFNLKESDTVKRRPKCSRDREGQTPEGPEGLGQTPGGIFQRVGSVGRGPPVPCKPPSSPKTPASPSPCPSRRPGGAGVLPRRTSIPTLTSVQVHTVSPQIGAQLQSHGAGPRATGLAPPPGAAQADAMTAATSVGQRRTSSRLPQICSTAGPGGAASLNIKAARSAFYTSSTASSPTSPSSPPSLAHPGELLAQRRLEETSTSLEAALKEVETKLAQDGHVEGSGGTVNILDDIGNMFDDLADQLDAMLE